MASLEPMIPVSALRELSKEWHSRYPDTDEGAWQTLACADELDALLAAAQPPADAPRGAEPPICTCWVDALTQVHLVTTLREKCPVHRTAPAPGASEPQGWQPIEDLLAYGRDESNSARIGKDRDAYQFYQGWVAALERVRELWCVDWAQQIAKGRAA